MTVHLSITVVEVWKMDFAPNVGGRDFLAKKIIHFIVYD